MKRMKRPQLGILGGSVQSVATRRRLSPKQSGVLQRIAGTLRERGCK